jgi:hypothetical protein
MIVRVAPSASVYSAFRENDRMTRTGLDGYLGCRRLPAFCGRHPSASRRLVGDRRAQAGFASPSCRSDGRHRSQATEGR